MNTVYKKLLSYFAFTILIVMSSTTSAEVNFHVGFDLGSANTTVDADDFNDGSLGTTATSDGKAIAMGVYGEMRFNRFLRMELGILDGGLATMDANSTGGTFWPAGSVSAKYGLAGIKVGAVATLPLGSSDNFKILAKGGFINWYSVVTFGHSGLNDADMDSGISPYMGVGVEYDMTKLMSLRIQHERFSAAADSDYFINGYDFDYAKSTIGLLFRF